MAATAKPIQIAVFYYNPSPYGVASEKAAVLEAKKLGGIQITTFDANNDPTAQNTQMTDAITTGKYKAFWVWALNGVAEAPTIKAAEAHHIKVAVADYTAAAMTTASASRAASRTASRNCSADVTCWTLAPAYAGCCIRKNRPRRMSR